MVGTCAHALVSDVGHSPTVFYSHPGNWTEGAELARANYTLHHSGNGGETWSPGMEVYGLGAGYSDAHVVPDAQAPGGRSLLMAFQKTFEPPDKNIEGGGYNMGFAVLDL